MLTAQYEFILPSDFPMREIQHRIETLGHKLDGFDGLNFKAYLYSEQKNGSKDNRYAPLYLWDKASGLSHFLASDGFKGLISSFGRPIVVQSLPISHYQSDSIKHAQFATREIIQLFAEDDLHRVMEEEKNLSQEMSANTNIMAHVSSLDTQNWTLLRWCLFQEQPHNFTEGRGVTIYQVGYVAQ